MVSDETFSHNPEDFEDAAEILKVLAHPVRLCIVRGLINECSNVSCIQSCLNMPQSTISQHLGKLRNSGIITGHRNGLEITYTVSNPLVIELINVLFK